MKIISLPIEPLENRYTEQWDRWFTEKAEKRYGQHNVKVLYGDVLGVGIRTGKVLDANSTISWKCEQIKRVARMFEEGEIEDGDTFFIHDLQFPGWEAILYMAHLNNKWVRVYGFIHASSWTKGDFAEPMARFLRPFEYGWVNAANGIFVGSDYHKQKILDVLAGRGESRDAMASKIHATGNPINQREYERRRDKGIRNKLERSDNSKNEYEMESASLSSGIENDRTKHDDDDRHLETDTGNEQIQNCKVKNRIIWPHRFHHEKDPRFAVDVIESIALDPCYYSNGRPEKIDLEFVFLNEPKSGKDDYIDLYLSRLERISELSRGNGCNIRVKWINIDDKDHYYAELSRATVVWSTSPEESFGYGNVEAIALGAHPVLTGCCSHIEIVEGVDRYLYEPGNINDCAMKLLNALENPSPPYIYIDPYENAFENMLDIIDEEG